MRLRLFTPLRAKITSSAQSLVPPSGRPSQESSLPILTVAVGTCVSSRAPRTEPYVRLSRIRLPPWVCDGEAIARPRMKDDRFREPGLRPLRHPYPRDAILVAAT